VTTTPTIRLVAIDLDGTLLNDSKRISDQTADALRCLPARGVKVIIASARPPRSVRQFHSHLQLDTLQINYNGALIWDEPAQKPFFHQPMHPGLVRRIIMKSRDSFPDVLVTCEILDKWFTDRFDQPYTTETGRLFKPDVVAPLDTFLNQPVTKLMLLGEEKMIAKLESKLVSRFAQHANIVRADPELIQIMDHRVDKAFALKLVANHYGVPMAEVMAIGDAANDVPMLKAAGVAIAMDNAHPAVKAVAHWVAPSNNDHGVHAALERYGLCG
jgi:Cof subfamily protein (haloacid dehalogenase superfamily)